MPDEVPESLVEWGFLATENSLSKNIELNESLILSFLVLFERLTPERRVIYLLREAFEYNYEEISEFLNKEVNNCRKIAQRAHDFINEKKVRFSSPPKNSMDLMFEFYNKKISVGHCVFVKILFKH